MQGAVWKFTQSTGSRSKYTDDVSFAWSRVVVFIVVWFSKELCTVTKYVHVGAMDPRCRICIFMGKTDQQAPKHLQQVHIVRIILRK